MGAPGTTPGDWSMTNGNLIRVMQKGTGVCVAGVHRIGRARTGPDADATPIANAYQIAASGALYDALEAMVGGKCPECRGWGEIAYFGELVRCRCNGQYRHSPSDANIASARAALALARGEQIGGGE